MPWDLEKGIDSLSKNSAVFDEINLFCYNFDENGNVLEAQSCKEKDLTAKLNTQKHCKLTLTIVNDVIASDGKAIRLKDPDVVHQILTDNNKKKQHLEQILSLVKKYNYAGVDIDYENINYSDRDLFTAFIKNLARALHTNNKILTVTVQPKIKEKTPDSLSVINWKEISAFADRINIMCYNFSSPVSGPGPIAPVDWLNQIIDFAEKEIPKEKIAVALALHGFDWSKTNTQSVTFNKAINKMVHFKSRLKWDISSQTPHFTYFEYGQKHEVWFENSASIASKLKVLKNRGIKNVAFWRLGQEDQKIYSLLLN